MLPLRFLLAVLSQSCRGPATCRPSAPGNQDRVSVNLDSTDESFVGHGCELNYDLTAAIGSGAELLDHRLVRRTGRREDIEIGEYLRAVDGDVEDALAGSRPEGLSKVQAHGVARSGGEAGNRVAERGARPDGRPLPCRLVDGHWGRIGHSAQINRVGMIGRPAANEVGIRDE